MAGSGNRQDLVHCKGLGLIISFGVLSHVRLLGIPLHVKLPVISLFIFYTTYFTLAHL